MPFDRHSLLLANLFDEHRDDFVQLDAADFYDLFVVYDAEIERAVSQGCNPLVDALYDAGRREFDRTKRGEKYGRIQEHLWEDQPFTWLYWRNGLYGFSRDLRGIVFSPRGPYTYSPGTRSLWRPPR